MASPGKLPQSLKPFSLLCPSTRQLVNVSTGRRYDPWQTAKKIELVLRPPSRTRHFSLPDDYLFRVSDRLTEISSRIYALPLNAWGDRHSLGSKGIGRTAVVLSSDLDRLLPSSYFEVRQIFQPQKLFTGRWSIDENGMSKWSSLWHDSSRSANVSVKCKARNANSRSKFPSLGIILSSLSL